MGYKYRIVKEENYRFELLPNNSNTCPVGWSCGYLTYQQAIDGIKKFKSYIKNKNKTDIIYSENQPIQKTGIIRGEYQGVFCFGTAEEKFYTRAYFQRVQIEKCIERIINNYNSNIRSELNML